MIDEMNYNDIQSKLESHLAELLHQLKEGAQPASQGNSINPNREDLAKSYDKLQRQLALEESLEQQVNQVQAALERLEKGEYGVCVDCGKEINPERLEALPYAARCVHCQSKVRN